VSKGEDVATAKQASRTAETVDGLAQLYLDKWAQPRKRSWKDDHGRLNRHVLPKWKHRAVADITRADVRELVEYVADASGPIEANRLASLLSKMFAFAFDRELVTANPAARLPKPGEEHARDRVFSDDEIRSLWKAWNALPVPMAAFFKLRMATAQRGGELTNMRWADVDLKAAWWTVPSMSTKNKLAHRVPLSASALAILKALRAEVDRDLRQRRAAGKKANEPVYVLDDARGKRQQAEAAAAFPVQDFRGHDLRRTAASSMAAGGIPRLTISKILNHVERGVTSVYDRHSYDAEKQAALRWWDQKLKSIVENKPRAVLPFAKGA
jgi:integrase